MKKIGYSIVYITAKDKKEAERLSHTLIKKRLAACVNIIPNMNSLYRWNGRIQKDKEVILIAKTRKSLVDSLIKKIKSLHSYENPCIISLPILKGNEDFLAWIREETKGCI